MIFGSNSQKLEVRVATALLLLPCILFAGAWVACDSLGFLISGLWSSCAAFSRLGHFGNDSTGSESNSKWSGMIGSAQPELIDLAQSYDSVKSEVNSA